MAKSPDPHVVPERDEIELDLRKMTLRAQGKGLKQTRLPLAALVAVRVLYLASLVVMVHLASHQSEAISVIARAILDL